MSYQVRECPYCGTQWHFETSGGRVTGGMSGFIEVTIYYHCLGCKDKTPEERLDFINRNEKRLKKKPNLHTQVLFDRNHSGVARQANTACTRQRVRSAKKAKPVPEKKSDKKVLVSIPPAAGNANRCASLGDGEYAAPSLDAQRGAKCNSQSCSGKHKGVANGNDCKTSWLESDGNLPAV